MNISTGEFRHAMGQFATGVSVVTTLDDGRPRGITVNALSSISLEPPLVMVALDRRRFITPMLHRARRYAVNILAEEHHELSDCFAGAEVTPNREAFCGAPWKPGRFGLPLLEGAIATLECEVAETFRVGDHDLFIGRVEALSVDREAASPLIFHRRRYLHIERASTYRVVGRPEHPAG
jgi:flavin reductase (DIM6/NTAB) family NADH-FMN oxidoreductase RutF